MITIVDYGVGNLFSLQCSLRSVGAEVSLAKSPAEVRGADALLLPGVGAFGDAAALLRGSGLGEAVTERAGAGVPLLGICLGMQLLFEKSYEYGEHSGLGLIPGSVVPMAPLVPAGYKIPQIGWNALHLTPAGKTNPLFRHIKEGDFVYFVHSYHGADCGAHTIATTDYGAEITAAVAKENVYGCQFHPEKSGGVGLSILRAFCELCGEKGVGV